MARASIGMTAGLVFFMLAVGSWALRPPVEATATLPAPSVSPAGTVCLADLDPARLDTLFDTEPAGVIGADYQRALALPDGRVLWTFQDAAIRLGPDEIRVVHNIAMIQRGTCFDVLYGGSRSAPASLFFRDRTSPFSRWFWPLDAAVGSDGRIYVFAAEMEERGPAYLTETVPVGTWVAVFDPTTDTIVDELRPPNSSVDLYGWSITSDDTWTYLYAQCYRQFGFDEYAFVAAFDRSCSTDVTVARVPRGEFFDPPRYWDGSTWQADPTRAASIIEAAGRRINANQFEWTGERFVSVNKEGDWWGDTILLAESDSATGPFRVYQELRAPVKCPDCNSFFATWVPAAAGRRADDTFVISLAHNRWDGIVSSLYRPTFHRVEAPIHLPPGSTFELSTSAGAAAVAINVAVVGPSAPGFVSVYPCAAGRPVASNVNHVNEPVISNLVLARPDPDGRVCLYSLTATNLVVDLSGTFGSEAAFRPLDRPMRVVDTRPGDGEPSRRLAAGEVLRFALPDEASGARRAVALNVIAVDPSAPGFLTAYPCDRSRPATSNVNYVTEPVVSNLVVVPTDASGEICVYSLVDVDVVVDLAGILATNGYEPLLDAERLVDTRDLPDGRLPAAGIVEVTVPEAATAAMLNVIAVQPDRPGFLTVYPCDEELPVASNVNHVNVPFVSNLVIARPSVDHRVCVFSSVAADVVVDLAGVLTSDAGYEASVVPERLVDTRIGTGAPGQFGVS